MAQPQQQLLLLGDEIKQLDSFLGEIPTKYGSPIVQFLNNVAVKRQQENENLNKFTAAAEVKQLPTDKEVEDLF